MSGRRRNRSAGDTAKRPAQDYPAKTSQERRCHDVLAVWKWVNVALLVRKDSLAVGKLHDKPGFSQDAFLIKVDRISLGASADGLRTVDGLNALWLHRNVSSIQIDSLGAFVVQVLN